MDVALLTMEDTSKPTTSSSNQQNGSSGEANSRDTTSPVLPDSADIMRMLTDASGPIFGLDLASDTAKCHLERLLGGATAFEDPGSLANFQFDPQNLGFADISPFSTLRNSSKTLKCPKCNWHYKYHETLEIHMKEKHNDVDVKCIFCVENRPHPKLARGETYSCGYKPYRCDVCRYSTTTKGNLSIHMQSDKHLHAMQELPNSIEFAANFACGAGAPVSRSSPIEESDLSLVCLICGIFATESIAEMMEHVEKDRSRTFQGDVTLLNGNFRCHLCPYNTTLKANFQLHTRTDKHLQKVQTANHLREGARPHTAIYRLSSTKSSVQVLCRQCQEVISSSEALREHRHFLSAKPTWRCRICSFECETVALALGHMTCHEPSTWTETTTQHDFKVMEDAAYACAGCDFTTKDVTDLEEHAKAHEEEASSGVASSSSQKASCALCMEPTSDLEKHLIEQHRIAESAIEKFLLAERTGKEASTSSEPSPEFPHRCSKCSMAFRSESQLQTHSLQHVFQSFHKCPTCGDSFDENNIVTHMLEHTKEECEMCSETFPSKEAFLSHLNSARHLQQAKKQLESTMVDLNSQDPTSSEKQRVYVCNVCKQSYPQAANLDVHMRSVTHQSRMGRLAELVANGDLNPEKPVFEQPGIPAQTIQSFIETTSSQPNLNDLMSLLTRSESDDVREEVNGLQLLTQIRVYGEPKITSLVPGLDGKIDNIALFDDQQALEISKIDCGVCGQQIVGILALNLHYEESHSSKIPSDVLRKFGEKILVAVQHINRENKSNDGSQSPQSNDDEPLEKKIKMEHNVDPNAAANQFAMFQQMMSCFPFMAPPGAAGAFSGFSPEMLNQLMNPAAAAAAAAAAANVGNSSTQKRARTRITDDQLKVLRQYFNINNSPSEAQIKEMSQKSGLPEKVIKHWFRNTLFKERQRDKDSPYNFSIPPQMGIDLDVYEKTGETKVHSLSSETPIKSELSSARATPTLPLPLVVEEKKLPEKIPETKSQSSSASSSQLNLQAMLSQMQNNFFDPTTFMAAAANPMTNPSTPSSCNTTSSGRRANRTRFTDFQLRTLQQFFDKQAYPKDDDLEALSKKLQLSPRVIVVWFQNARQKARKIYENQPNHENSDRFVRTPGSNFQCKRCNQVFQRYYELIQHQQKKCYKDDGAALASDNKSVEESLTDEEKAQLLAQQQVLTMDIPKFQPADLLKMIGAAGGSSSSSDVLMKMCENIGFHKTCLFCQQEFRDKNAMTEHMNQKHNMAFANIDVDMMPDASDMFLDNKESALDLSGSSVDYRESISTSPPRSEDDVLTEQLDDSTFAALLSNGGSGSECRSPASSSKRFRTHLTPMQVQMMKSVFNEYKTPSMAECELLGKEVGLHKRVVQVWFQNARAKERKTRGTVDEESRSGELNCEQCDKSFGTRLALQDHLFTAEHIGVLRAQLKKEGVSELTTASVTECSPEKKSSKTAQNAFDLSGFPFLNPLIDIQMYGTPIQFLQVPEEIKTQISTDIKEKKPRTVFSQDGLNVEKLKDALPENEKSHLTTTQKEVGWACPTCTFVFQEEKKLREHQRQICQCDKTLTLVQTHYSCKSCKSDFCLQSEYLFHLSMPPHI